jgi:ATP-dependent protease Clp ATPase subunit
LISALSPGVRIKKSVKICVIRGNNMNRNYIKIGVAGPVGSGKTALIERLSRIMCKDYSLAVQTKQTQYNSYHWFDAFAPPY